MRDENISRRQMLALGAVAPAALSIPAATKPEVTLAPEPPPEGALTPGELLLREFLTHLAYATAAARVVCQHECDHEDAGHECPLCLVTADLRTFWGVGSMVRPAVDCPLDHDVYKGIPEVNQIAAQYRKTFGMNDLNAESWEYTPAD